MLRVSPATARALGAEIHAGRRKATAKIPRALSTGEERLARDLKAAAHGPDGEWELPLACRQYHFHPERKWAFDFAWPAKRLAVEIQGLKKGGAPGAHQRVDGLTREYEKLNSAVLAGWRVLLFTPAQVRSGYALDTIRKALG
jgi:hypothetical protein